MGRGPKEQAVWDTLESRPAGVINRAGREANLCFAALFNGARNGMAPASGWKPTFGKAEAEWAWPDGWNELRDLGLVEWKEIQRPYHPSFPPMVEIVWSITEKGWEVRNDDLAWFREIINVRDQDEQLTSRDEDSRPE